MSQSTLPYKLVGLLLNKNCVGSPKIILLYSTLLNMLSIRVKKFIFKNLEPQKELLFFELDFIETCQKIY